MSEAQIVIANYKGKSIEQVKEGVCRSEYDFHTIFYPLEFVIICRQ